MGLVARPGTSDWYAAAVLSGAVHAAVAAVAFGLLAPVTLLGVDLWAGYVTHESAPPSFDAGTLVGIAYVALVAGSVALVPAVLIGSVLGAGNGWLALTAVGRSWPAVGAVGLLSGVVVGQLVPRLLLGDGVLVWLRVLTGVVAGTACAAQLRHLAVRAPG